MTPIFRKRTSPDELFEKVAKAPDDADKVIMLASVLSQCRGKDKELGYRIIAEVLRISKDPVYHLGNLLMQAHENEVAVFIVDKIASYGMEHKHVHDKIYQIGSFSGDNKAARKRAREHYDKYYQQVTGGDPLQRKDLLIPPW